MEDVEHTHMQSPDCTEATGYTQGRTELWKDKNMH